VLGGGKIWGLSFDSDFELVGWEYEGADPCPLEVPFWPGRDGMGTAKGLNEQDESIRAGTLCLRSYGLSRGPVYIDRSAGTLYNLTLSRRFQRSNRDSK
jgi:hypothetical protein